MAASGIGSPGISFLPRVFARPDKIGSAPGLRWYHHAILAGVLIFPGAISAYLEFVLFPGRLWQEEVAHRLVEGFWATASLSVFYILHRQHLFWNNRRLLLMAYAFLAMGVLDLFHSFAPPGSNIFVWFHSMSAVFGAVLLACSVWVRPARSEGRSLAPWQAWSGTLGVIAGLVAFGIASHVLAGWLPTMKTAAGFSLFARSVNTLAGVLFLVSGFSFLVSYRWNREPILFVLAVGMLLLTESQALFSMSELWDVAWWVWHAIKSAIYVAVLAVLAYGFGQTFAQLERSRRQLLEAYQRLEVAQASLVESEKLATLGQLAAGLAHEVRNPLGAISNCLGVLRRRPLAKHERTELLDIAEREADRIAGIVANTLSLARPQSRRLEPVAMAAVSEQALHSIPAKEIGEVDIVCEFAPEPLLVSGDPSQLEEVVWNLVTNALQILAGRGHVQLTLQSEDNWVVLRVRDSGPGMADTVRSRAFEPFFSSRRGGTGLGLSIVQRIVKEHGGSIVLASSPAGGTEATVRIPAAASSNTARSVAALGGTG